ncbi:transglycosylase SLT domain-containing protein [Acidicapsa ligni]|uniref:transglycosylase SLT domain-containing protein n=1 Tax=Acidicapsa ligni TaxID=542300 RepID=UPI0021E00138|nr:transglycosylase SLT domain-containing protein [Acidicapsa ligni]
MGIAQTRIFGRTAHMPSASTVSLLLALGVLVLGLSGCPATPTTAQPSTGGAQAAAPALQQPAPQPASRPAGPAAVLTPAQQHTQQLIARVEQSFQSGQTHYRQGQLVQAKKDFDTAVDSMLASGLDIKADPQLDDEFNRILDAVNALEMDALKRGNGFAPAIEPTPADVANDVTFEVDPNLVAKAKAELVTTKSDIPLVINDYVASYINFFANTQKGHNTLKHSLQRSGRYKAMIQRVMAEEGVPQDLIYLAVAESAFQPQVVNHSSGAGGMWQFMPHDKYYGLASNAYVDERFDPEKSTHATAKYMKFIYNQLGDWYLAMAGYNWGTGRVQQAVQKTGYADFWELYKRNNLPAQTKDYVPEIIAAIIISKNPTQYGFDDVQLDPPITYDTVKINYSVDLRLVADIVGSDPQELALLNPSLLRLATPPPSLLESPFDLHVPSGTAAIYEQRISEIPEDRRAQWRYHRVSSEDTLASIARTFHVSADQLATVNQLHADDSLDGVEALVIPVPLPSAPAARTDVYRARRGDTLVTIADRFGVSLEDLRRWNHGIGASVAAGQRIRVTEPVHLAPHSRDRNHRSTQGAKQSIPAHGKASKYGGAEQSSGKQAANKKENYSIKKTVAKSSNKTQSASEAHKQGDSKKGSKTPKSTKKKNIQK